MPLARVLWLAGLLLNGQVLTTKPSKLTFHQKNIKRVNPLAAVPALDIGGKRAMTQAPAILQYIVDSYPQANIGANDGIENAFEMNETMSFLASDFHPAFWPFFFPQRYTTATDETSLNTAKEAAYARVDRAMLHLDKLIADVTGTSIKAKRAWRTLMPM